VEESAFAEKAMNSAILNQKCDDRSLKTVPANQNASRFVSSGKIWRKFGENSVYKNFRLRSLLIYFASSVDLELF
jgi:hypothetical protein